MKITKLLTFVFSEIQHFQLGISVSSGIFLRKTSPIIIRQIFEKPLVIQQKGAPFGLQAVALNVVLDKFRPPVLFSYH